MSTNLPTANVTFPYSHTVGFIANQGRGFNNPIDLAIDPSGVLYVLNRAGPEVGIRPGSVMHTLLLSDFFKAENVRLAKVKSPAELVAGTARLAGSHRFPEWSIVNLAMDVNFMGQEILNPPTVEGWHTGREWIDTGNLVERINSAAFGVGDVEQPGVRRIIDRLMAGGKVLSAD